MRKEIKLVLRPYTYIHPASYTHMHLPTHTHIQSHVRENLKNLELQVIILLSMIWYFIPTYFRTGFSNLSVHQYHMEDLLKQIAGYYPKSLWFSRFGIESQNLHFLLHFEKYYRNVIRSYFQVVLSPQIHHTSNIYSLYDLGQFYFSIPLFLPLKNKSDSLKGYCKSYMR